jgi:hypothetical protein
MTATSVSIALLALAVVFSALIKAHIAAEHRLDNSAANRLMSMCVGTAVLFLGLLAFELWNFAVRG